ncbi:MAG: dihydrodipicolinate synthase family protein [Anaeroplasmataceae bacterium]|nr:dihydrodipicolinate synthase family protein [Anaeroplasmataceae bacterium]
MAKYLTPAVTPLLPNGEIDFESCKNLYEHLIKGGVDGILIFGSIGEFFAFSIETKKKLIEYAHKVIADRVELIVGTTSMLYDEIVELSNYALSLGIKSVMIIPPYYFHFTDESVYDYYDHLAKDIKGNIYLYNFPDRTGYEISVSVVKKLAENHKNIIGIKDTISGMDHTRELIKTVKSIRPDFKIYSGFDDNFAHNALCGGDGCIAGISNLFPELTSLWVRAFNSNDMKAVHNIQHKIDKLLDIYAVGKPFVPFIKQALADKNIIAYPTATKPMPTATKEQINQIKTILEEYNNAKNN